MHLQEQLAAERRRRTAAEAEAAQLRARLATWPSTSSPPDGWLVGQLPHYPSGLASQVIDNSPNLVYVEDETGRCVLVNRSYTLLQSQRADPAETTPPVDDEKGYSYEESFLLRDGRTVWYNTTHSYLTRPDGSRYRLTFSSDITDLKRAHQVAEESVRAKQMFMANMSHEIRTPLHGVMGLAGLLLQQPLSPEQADYVAMIQSSTENLLVVINDLLDFAKIESGKISLETIPFDLLEPVREAVRTLSFKADEKGLLLRVVEPPDGPLPLVLGDPHRLRQVLINLLGNAVKFTPHGAVTVTIAVGPRQQAMLPVTFSVADTGIGITPESLPHIFSGFRQADNSIARLYGGTGLGLTICQHLVELQGGQLTVSSQLGQGSCFRFTIAYALSAESLAPLVAAPAPATLLQGLRVLLAEDNAVNQLIVVSLLTQWQVTVELAQNGEEALVLAQRTPYNLILMDIHMPRLDGIEATARLRASAGPNQQTPIVALTGDAIRLNADSYRGLGFTDFLTKPYGEATLYQLLARMSHRELPAPLPAAVAAPLEQPGLRYDFDQLGRLAHDGEFIRGMLTLFVTEVPGKVAGLRQAVKQANWPAAAHAAHALKTTFGSFNIQPETNHLRRLEELAETEAPAPAEFRPLLLAVTKATTLFCAIFEQELALRKASH